MNYKSIINLVKHGGKVSQSDFDTEMMVDSKESIDNYLQIKYAGEATTKETKSNNITLFSEFFGADHKDGLVSELKTKRLHYISAMRPVYKMVENTKFQVEVIHLQLEYEKQLIAKRKWMGLMGLMERLLFQYDCFSAPKLVFSTQKQKSGTKHFHYILVRSPFYDLIEGKNEIRLYYNKLEDYPMYKTIDELVKGDSTFVHQATLEIQKKMREVIDSNPISFKEIQDALNELETEKDRKVVADYEDQKMSWMKKHNFEKPVVEDLKGVADIEKQKEVWKKKQGIETPIK